MFLKVMVVASLVAAAVSHPEAPPQNYGAPAPSYGPPPPPPEAPPKYDFDWKVKDYIGNDFGHQETRDGYNTQGSYYVQLPDGRLQRVDYTVHADSGFVAQVNFEGEAQYPEPKKDYAPPPSPSYAPPPPPTYAPPPPPTYAPPPPPPPPPPPYNPPPPPTYN